MGENLVNLYWCQAPKYKYKYGAWHQYFLLLIGGENYEIIDY